MVERALRIAATHHRPQSRKGGEIPYITHPVGVALLLQRFGFNDDELLAAALLHDVVEDTECTLEELAAEFPSEVVESVAALSERKYDEQGVLRPWKDRKLEHIEHVKAAGLLTRTVVLADKLHNLATMQFDLASGEDMWSRFRAGRSEVEWYHRSMIAAASQDDKELQPLADACLKTLDEILGIDPKLKSAVGGRVSSEADGPARATPGPVAVTPLRSSPNHSGVSRQSRGDPAVDSQD